MIEQEDKFGNLAIGERLRFSPDGDVYVKVTHNTARCTVSGSVTHVRDSETVVHIIL